MTTHEEVYVDIGNADVIFRIMQKMKLSVSVPAPSNWMSVLDSELLRALLSVEVTNRSLGKIGGYPGPCFCPRRSSISK